MGPCVLVLVAEPLQAPPPNAARDFRARVPRCWSWFMILLVCLRSLGLSSSLLALVYDYLGCLRFLRLGSSLLVVVYDPPVSCGFFAWVGVGPGLSPPPLGSLGFLGLGSLVLALVYDPLGWVPRGFSVIVPQVLVLVTRPPGALELSRRWFLKCWSWSLLGDGSSHVCSGCSPPGLLEFARRCFLVCWF